MHKPGGMMAGEPEQAAAWLLAIDTSTDQAGIALTDGAAFAELSWRSGRDQTVSLLDQIDRLRTLVGIEVSQIGAVAVATGPGMFNGLRIGMAIAKGFVLGQDAAIIGLSTLALTAAAGCLVAPRTVAVVAAGRGRVVWAPYDTSGAEPLPLAAPLNTVIADLPAALAPHGPAPLILGDLTENEANILRAAGAIVPPAPARTRRVANLAAIGHARWRMGRLDDPVSLQPTYLHAARA